LFSVDCRRRKRKIPVDTRSLASRNSFPTTGR